MIELQMLAFDLGASNGRAVHGRLQDGRLEMKEIHRFSNDPVRLQGRLYWDVLRLFHEMKTGMQKSIQMGLDFDCVGVNTWGNTIGLLDSQGDLLGNPYHYRDNSVEETFPEFSRRFSPQLLFRQTLYKPMTIQPTVFWDYLCQKKPWMTKSAQRALMISDLFNYFLSGQQASERTMAATSSMVDMGTGQWNRGLMRELGMEETLFPPIIENGTILGPMLPELTKELGLQRAPRVIAVAGHDTAAASGCIDSDRLAESLYLSCGTWSCMGCTVRKPVESAAMAQAGITNDTGLYGTMHLRFNHTGLWILQECKREWEKDGSQVSWQDLLDQAAKAKPFLAAIDTEAPDFFKPGQMPEKIREFCRKTGQMIPRTPGQVSRVVLESLAYRYRYSLDCLEKFAGYSFEKLTILGGGSKNSLLCQWTCNVLNRPVTAGIQEASVTGNFFQQAIAMGRVKDLDQGRLLVKNLWEETVYQPESPWEWNLNYQSFTNKFHWKNV